MVKITFTKPDDNDLVLLPYLVLFIKKNGLKMN